MDRSRAWRFFLTAPKWCEIAIRRGSAGALQQLRGRSAGDTCLVESSIRAFVVGAARPVCGAAAVARETVSFETNAIAFASRVRSEPRRIEAAFAHIARRLLKPSFETT